MRKILYLLVGVSSLSSYATLNGRTLDDDINDVTIALVFNDQLEAGDNTVKAGLSTDCVDGNDKPHSNSFPYIASSH
ncbi:DUF4331 family protein [Ekhidna sp.]|uniref:DUF4331 family protein n=1 Tax=Ekhidna sp. TaxID=2608089 RepID=UPI003296A3B9